VRTFCATADTLGQKLGILLFQLPPTFKKDVTVLEEFLAELPPRVRGAFEFRHASWLDDEVYACLKRRNLALCVADTERLSTPVVRTADYGYFRLRDEGYTPSDISQWARVISEHASGDTFVYFKHEEAGKGPEFARGLMNELGLSPGGRHSSVGD
jgi:uncharacterized protein YecE (DUF72 family)